MKTAKIGLTCLAYYAVLLFACAGSKQVSIVDLPVDTENQQEGLIEDVDPMTLGDFTAEESVQSKQGPQPADIDQLLKGDEGISNDGPDEVQGYRVQLIATRDEEEARSVRRDALLSFDERVYLVYDNPYYKVRAGDCLSRYEADVLQEKAVQMGYAEAWVVRTTVSVKPQTDESDTDIAP
jgi:hypothetical protein